MPTLFDLTNDKRSKSSHLYGRPSSGKTSLALYKAEQMIRDQKRILYLDTHGCLDPKQVAMVAPSMPQFVITWSNFDNVLEAISIHGAEHIILDDLAPFDLYLSDEGFKSNFSGFLKRMAEVNISVDVINQIRSKPGLDHPVPYYEEYVTTHFRNNIEVRRVEHVDNAMIYQIKNHFTKLYLEVLIDNMGNVDEAYTIALLMKEPLTPEFRERLVAERAQIFEQLITRYGFEVPPVWI